MASSSMLRKIRNQIRKRNRQLHEQDADPRNADRALWGALAVVEFANVTGLGADVEIDPETVVGDLLAAIMHWCDVQRTNPKRQESIDFEDALSRARNHYIEEIVEEREQLP